MRTLWLDFWGKFKRNEDGSIEWHPLIDHCADVAASCEALLRYTIIGRRLAVLGGTECLDSGQIDRLAALAAFHDAGKFNLGFQSKADPNHRAKSSGHVQPLLDLFGSAPTREQTRLRKAMPVDEIKFWTDGKDGLDGLELLFAAIAHHGKPSSPSGSGPDPRLWQVDSDGRDPFDGIARLSAKVREWFPGAFAGDATPLSSIPAFQHAFSGLVTLADWIGSDSRIFRYSEPDDGERIDFARSQAKLVLREIGLDSSAARSAFGAAPRHFEEIFPSLKPNAAQRKMLERPISPGGSLTILESETGSGKTEAALARYFKLFASGEVDGLYFALPTRTAAVQIHRRIEHAVERAFPDPAVRPAVTLAVPGYLKLDDSPDAHRMAPFEALYPDDENARWRFRHWASEHPKRYLAGAISVGTIDQALLSALVVSHSHLRATSLLRQLLVVDEVHASDAYMTTILREVLRFHLAAGGHSLLLSATLGSAAAESLISAGEPFPRNPPRLTEAEHRTYPMMTTVVGRAQYIDRMALPGESRPKSVCIEIVPAADKAAAIAAHALDAGIAGARVLIVRNTVHDCIATQVELETLAKKAPDRTGLLFAIGGRPAPHHSRFTGADRVALDKELETRFGKDSNAPCVVSATQTVQQSLDIDADLLITDLCPMDVMLQRIGRLHRNRNRNRPDLFQAARVIVLVPEKRDLTPPIGRDGRARGEHGLGTVYPDLRVIEATWRYLESFPALEIPRMNRAAVESATHPKVLAAIVAELGSVWKKHAHKIDGEKIAAKGHARLNCVDRSLPLAEIVFPSSSDARILTRLGESDRIVEFPVSLVGPFGHAIDRLTLPGWLAWDADPQARAQDVSQDGETITFTFGRRKFIYDRMGLRPAEPQSNIEEDATDA